MKIFRYVIMVLILEYGSPQFTSSTRYLKKPCELRGTALVEQFFNIIFTEFHRSPPTCTCVQMCPDQPTYCYPNGCFRKQKKKETPVSRIQQEGAKTIFLVDNEKDILTDVIGNINSAVTPASGKYERSVNTYLIGLPSPFKDIVFKYKRLPKLEMKYNLREQVKHTKCKRSEVDVSKTRWPTNQQVNRQAYKLNKQINANYFTTARPATYQLETTKYPKRYLNKRENQKDLDIGALYLNKEASNFSLETLIENLIERGLEGFNSTLGLNISKSGELKDDGNHGDSKFRNKVSDIVLKDILSEVNPDKKHQNDSDTTVLTNYSTTTVYSEMISTMSKEIDKQNIASTKIMEHFTGRKYGEISGENVPNVINSREPSNYSTTARFFPESTRNKIFTNNSDVIITSTTDKLPPSLHKKFVPVINGQVIKSKQRIVRKLRNRKLN